MNTVCFSTAELSTATTLVLTSPKILDCHARSRLNMDWKMKLCSSRLFCLWSQWNLTETLMLLYAFLLETTMKSFAQCLKSPLYMTSKYEVTLSMLWVWAWTNSNSKVLWPCWQPQQFCSAGAGITLSVFGQGGELAKYNLSLSLCCQVPWLPQMVISEILC